MSIRTDAAPQRCLCRSAAGMVVPFRDRAAFVDEDKRHPIEQIGIQKALLTSQRPLTPGAEHQRVEPM